MARWRRTGAAWWRHRVRIMYGAWRPADDDWPGRWRRWQDDRWRRWWRDEAHRRSYNVGTWRWRSDLYVHTAVATGHVPRTSEVEVAHAEAGSFGFGGQGSGSYQQGSGCADDEVVVHVA